MEFPLVRLPAFHPRLGGRAVYCFRDDLLARRGGIVGNKARKLHAYLGPSESEDPKLENSNLAPEVVSEVVSEVISYGSLQSNAMAALSEWTFREGIPFVYYAKKPPASLRSTKLLTKPPPDYYHNYYKALAEGMQLREIPDQASEASKTSQVSAGANQATWFQEPQAFVRFAQSQHPGALWFLEGAASPRMGEGFRLLAQDLLAGINQEGIETADLVLASGTGVSAAFLHHYLRPYRSRIRVYSLPVVIPSQGRYGRTYLEKMLAALALPLRIGIGMGEVFDPDILPQEIFPRKEFGFARPHPRLWQRYRELLSTGIEFDLVYDSVAWDTVLEHLSFFTGEALIYIHQGAGGNSSMLGRYREMGIGD